MSGPHTPPPLLHLDGIDYARVLEEPPGQQPSGGFGPALQMNLTWHRHDGVMDGTDKWQPSAHVGEGWDFDVLLPGPFHSVYYAGKDGELFWRQHTGSQKGQYSWSDPRPVGSGWQQLHMANEKNGFVGFLCDWRPAGDPVNWAVHRSAVLYGLRDDGELWWYRHEGAADGAAQWTGGGLPNVTVANYSRANLSIFSGQEGVIYRIDQNGDLYRNRHDGNLDGTPTWSGERKIGQGWRDFTQVMSPGMGVIYAIREDGGTSWYRFLGFDADGNPRWANNGQPVELHQATWRGQYLVRSEIRQLPYIG